MSMKDEVLELKKELEVVREESLVMSLLSDYKKDKKRLFIMWIITFLALVGVTCYTIYLLNDISYIDETTITQETEQGYNNYIGNDGDIINGETDN